MPPQPAPQPPPAARGARTIRLHPHAPPKPSLGAACNGCGQCCALEPCPLGMLLSRRLSGACSALQWSEGGRHYRCGVLEQPQRWLPWLPAPLARRLARRWIAAAAGCDAELSPAEQQR